MHYSQIGRYEEKGAQPSADILAKLANALEVTSDYLMNGTSDDLANSSLTDKELLNQFKMIEKMTEEMYILIEKYTTFSLKSIPLLVFNELLIKITSNAKTYDKNGYEARNLEKVLSRM